MTCKTWWKPKRRSCEDATGTRTWPSSGSDRTDTSLREMFMNQWCLWWVSQSEPALSARTLYAICVAPRPHLLSKLVPVFTAERWECWASVYVCIYVCICVVNCGKGSRVNVFVYERHMSSGHKNVLICTCMGKNPPLLSTSSHQASSSLLHIIFKQDHDRPV